MSHMVKVIHGERKTLVEYKREFELIECPNAGFSFPCKENGELIVNEFYDSWKPNYDNCIAHPEKYRDIGIQKYTWNYREPNVGTCSCGEEIVLERDTMCPKCGQWYNVFGQALVDPEYWEEDEDY